MRLNGPLFMSERVSCHTSRSSPSTSRERPSASGVDRRIPRRFAFRRPPFQIIPRRAFRMAGLTCSAVYGPERRAAPLLHPPACTQSAANAAIKANGVVSWTCLQAGQSDLSQAFAASAACRLRNARAPANGSPNETGAPCCRGALAALDIRKWLTLQLSIGTHSLFIAKVVARPERATSANQPPLPSAAAYATTRKALLRLEEQEHTATRREHYLKSLIT